MSGSFQKTQREVNKLTRTCCGSWYIKICASASTITALIIIANSLLATGINVKRPSLSQKEARTLSTQEGRYYPPALYPQVSNLQNYPHNSTWYAISAYIDMRPLAYGETPDVAIVSGGPEAEVNVGTTWFARMFALHTGSVVAELDCETTIYKAIDHDMSKHISAPVICKTKGMWKILRRLSDELGVCLIRKVADFCDIASVVPVGVPPRYPLPWVDETHMRYDNRGKARIAMCVPGVRGNAYASTFRFFLEYYGKLGVDAIHLYMQSPGHEFASIAENIASQQNTRSSKGLTKLIILPWCMQLGASYGCKHKHARIPLSGFHDFVSNNYGQLLAHQDCLYRSMGEYRWVLFVDLDEYILPRRPNLVNLHELVLESIRENKGVTPAELVMRSAFYDNCWPTPLDNTSIHLSHVINHKQMMELPRPAWSSARVSALFPERSRTKYMCDPLGCDRLGIHYAASKFCDRYLGKDISTNGPISCDTVVMLEKDAIVHHARVKTENEADRKCSEITGVQEVDWSMTNFVINMHLVRL